MTDNFLCRFPWRKSALNPYHKEKLELLLLEYCDIFAKHRLDVGYNIELNIKLTPEHSMPMYFQGPTKQFDKTLFPFRFKLTQKISKKLSILQLSNFVNEC